MAGHNDGICHRKAPMKRQVHRVREILETTGELIGIHFCKEEILSRTSWKERNVLSYTHLKSHMSILTELSFFVCMIKESWCEFNRCEYVTKTKQLCMYIWNKLHMFYRCLYVYHKYLIYVRFFNYNSTQWVTLMSSLNCKKNCNKKITKWIFYLKERIFV